MRRRSNPWPALVDLFGALLIVSFGGLMVLYAQARDVVEEGAAGIRELVEVRKALTAPGAAGALPLSERKGCEPDICVDITIEFAPGEDKVSEEQSNDLRLLAERLIPALEKFSDPKDVQIVVEGHTDKTNLIPESQPRMRFMKNWVLSSQRASSVLFELQTYGLSPNKFNVIAIGYADSQPIPGFEELPAPPSEELERRRKRNRRTTLRLRYRPPLPLDVRVPGTRRSVSAIVPGATN